MNMKFLITFKEEKKEKIVKDLEDFKKKSKKLKKDKEIKIVNWLLKRFKMPEFDSEIDYTLLSDDQAEISITNPYLETQKEKVFEMLKKVAVEKDWGNVNIELIE